MHTLAAAVVLLASGTQIAAASLADGLIAYYPFTGTANDESGNGHDGVVHGATLTADRFGTPDRAYAFDGTDVIEVPDSPALTLGAGSFTIATWMRFGAAGGYYLMGHDQGPGDIPKWIFWVSPSTLYLIYCSPSCPSGGVRPGSGYNGWAAQVARWYHLAIRRDGSQFTMFVDGSPVSTATEARAITDPAAPLRIGNAEGGHPERVFRGAIDEVRVYGRALSDQELLQLATENPCVQGDCNCDGVVNAGDRTCLVTKFFDPSQQGTCACEDCNRSGNVNAADAPCITLCAFGQCPATP